MTTKEYLEYYGLKVVKEYKDAYLAYHVEYNGKLFAIVENINFYVRFSVRRFNPETKEIKMICTNCKLRTAITKIKNYKGE